MLIKHFRYEAFCISVSLKDASMRKALQWILVRTKSRFSHPLRLWMLKKNKKKKEILFYMSLRNKSSSIAKFNGSNATNLQININIKKKGPWLYIHVHKIQFVVKEGFCPYLDVTLTYRLVAPEKLMIGPAFKESGPMNNSRFPLIWPLLSLSRKYHTYTVCMTS